MDWQKNQGRSVEPPSEAGVKVVESRHSAGHGREPQSALSKFFLIIAGHARWESGGRQYLLGPDTVCHIPAGQEYSRDSLPQVPLVSYVLSYRPEILTGSLRGQLDAMGLVTVDLSRTTINQGGIIRGIFEEMLFEQDARQEGWEVMLQSRLLDLSIRILRMARRRTPLDVPQFAPGQDTMDRVARYALGLQSNVIRQETLNDAARAVGLSRRHFGNIFRQVTGQSWRRHVLSLRLKHAASLLKETDRAITAVAFESGFQDLSNFYHHFKAAHGSTPLAYREQCRVRLTVQRSARPETKSASTPLRFAYRGLKGWFWSMEQYLQELPLLPKFELNFLMNCYGSMIVHNPGEPWCNEWWKPLEPARKDALGRIIKGCAEKNVTFCFAMHPQIASPRPLKLGSKRDVRALCQHYLWVQQQGINWFSLCLDGAVWGPKGPQALGEQHALLANAVFSKLQAAGGSPELIVCPAICWGDASNPEHQAYLSRLGDVMDPAVRVFWNGDAIVTPRITRVAAESFRKTIRHRLFVWDNYPVNDGTLTLHLGPLRGRAADLCEVAEGYLCNSMRDQNEISRIPISTCAEYALDPSGYSPARAIGSAIQRFGRTQAQQDVLKTLVEAYPGFIVVGGGTGTNPVRAQFGGILTGQHSEALSRKFVADFETLLLRFGRAFPGSLATTRHVMEEDLRWMRQQLALAN